MLLHRELKRLLHDASGESRFVVVVFLDVRGFSAWMSDPSEAAIFLKSVYTRILEEYFSGASYFKPTGDGLMVVLDYTPATLSDVVRNAVSQSIRLVEDFEHLTSADDMVNFSVPKALGIGIARGSATRLVSKRKTLDYSGSPLNLAARLMDIARPSGVVFGSENLRDRVLGPELASRFTEESVYIKSLAEEEPLDVRVLAGKTVIPDSNRYPINRFSQYTQAPEQLTFKELAQRELFHAPLAREPVSDEVSVYVSYPDIVNGRKHPRMTRTHTSRARWFQRFGRNLAEIDFRPIAKKLDGLGVRPNWKVTIIVEYPIREAP